MKLELNPQPFCYGLSSSLLEPVGSCGLHLWVLSAAFGLPKHSGHKMIRRVRRGIKAELQPSLHEGFAMTRGFSHLALTPTAQDGRHIKTKAPKIKPCGNDMSHHLVLLIQVQAACERQRQTSGQVCCVCRSVFWNQSQLLQVSGEDAYLHLSQRWEKARGPHVLKWNI